MQPKLRTTNHLTEYQLSNLNQLKNYLISISETHCYSGTQIAPFDEKLGRTPYNESSLCNLLGHAYYGGIGVPSFSTYHYTRLDDPTIKNIAFQCYANETFVPLGANLEVKYKGQFFIVPQGVSRFLFDTRNPANFQQAVARINIILSGIYSDIQLVGLMESWYNKTGLAELSFKHRY